MATKGDQNASLLFLLIILSLVAKATKIKRKGKIMTQKEIAKIKADIASLIAENDSLWDFMINIKSNDELNEWKKEFDIDDDESQTRVERLYNFVENLQPNETEIKAAQEFFKNELDIDTRFDENLNSFEIFVSNGSNDGTWVQISNDEIREKAQMYFEGNNEEISETIAKNLLYYQTLLNEYKDGEYLAGQLSILNPDEIDKIQQEIEEKTYNAFANGEFDKPYEAADFIEGKFYEIIEKYAVREDGFNQGFDNDKPKNRKNR